MGYIYKITNKVNNKIYIGQTTTSIKTRMSKHYNRAKTGINLTGIDAAIQKYGKNNFEVEKIIECPNEDLNAQEQYYINKYDSFNNGYNLTIGGQYYTTSLNLDINTVIQKYQELKTVQATAEYFKCSIRTISDLLKNNGITVKSQLHLENLSRAPKTMFKDGDNAKQVRIIELNIIFNSLKECSQWLIDNNYSKASTMEAARKSLSRALNGDRNSYCGLHFEFIKN